MTDAGVVLEMGNHILRHGRRSANLVGLDFARTISRDGADA